MKNPREMVRYKRGIELGTPITVHVTLPAADWSPVMNWIYREGGSENNLVALVLEQIGDQLSDLIYDKESLKAASARHAENMATADPLAFLRNLADITGGEITEICPMCGPLHEGKHDPLCTKENDK